MAAAAALAGGTSTAEGQSVWNGATSGNWSVAGNWNGGAGPAPTSGDTTQLTFNASGTQSYTATNNLGAFQLNKLTLNNAGTGTITLAGVAAATDRISFVGANPTLTATGNSLITAQFVGDTNSVFTLEGTGTVVQSSNSNAFDGTLIINGGIFHSSNISGTHNFDPKSIVVNNSGTYRFGGGGNPNLPAYTYVTVNTGGVVEWDTGEQFGGFILDGGEIKASAGMTADGNLSELRNGVIRRTTGSPSLGTTDASAAWSKVSTGTVTLDGVSIAGAGSFFIKEGVLATNAGITITTLQLGDATAATSGTLRYTGLSTTMVRPVNVTGGNGVIDVEAPGTIYTLSGDVTGDGTLTKAGAGTLVLPANVTNTGGVTVTQGVARVTPTALAGSLAATGGVVAVASGSGTTSLQVPRLNLQNAATTLRFELDGTAPTSPLLVVSESGGLTLSGNPKLDLTSSNGLPLGTYTLIDYTGTPVTSGFSFTLPGRTAGGLVYNTAQTRIDLNVTGTDSVEWTGAANATWDAGTAPGVGGTNNFTLVQGGTATNFVNTDVVAFNDNASSKTVNLGTTLQPASVTVETSDTYTFSGTGQIAGTGALVKRGSGTLVVNTNNTYTGGTTIESGTLQLGNGGTTGSIVGSVAIGPDGKLTINKSGASDFNGTLSGSGIIDVNGAGVVTLANDSPLFTGTINLKAGKLAVSSFTKLGSVDAAAANPTIQFDGGTLLITANTSSGAAQAWSFGPGGGTIETPAGTSSSKQGVSLSGGGKFIKTGLGQFTVGSNSSAFFGEVEVQQGVLQFTSNQFRAVNGMKVFAGGQYSIRDDAANGTFGILPDTTLELNGSGPDGTGAFTLYDQSGTATTGTGPRTTFSNNIRLATDSVVTSVNGTATNRRTTLVFGGIVSGPGRLIKEGSGLLALPSENTYTGGTTVTAGTLIVTNTAGSATGTGPVQTAAGTTLAGTGSIAGPLTVGGTIAPGTSPGKLTASSVTLTSGSVFSVEVGGPDGGGTPVAGTNYDQLVLTGSGTSLSINSGAQLQVIELANLVPGQSFTIVDNSAGGNVSGQFPSMITGSKGGLYQVSYAAGDVVLTSVPVPEPTSIAAISVATLGLLARRRRR